MTSSLRTRHGTVRAEVGTGSRPRPAFLRWQLWAAASVAALVASACSSSSGSDTSGSGPSSSSGAGGNSVDGATGVGGGAQGSGGIANGMGGFTGAGGASAAGGAASGSGGTGGVTDEEYPFPASAPDENGANLWLRYPHVPIPGRLAEYQAALTHVVAAGASPTLQRRTPSPAARARPLRESSTEPCTAIPPRLSPVWPT
jgi:alpha-glucuronidase